MALMILSFTPASFNRIMSWVPMSKLAVYAAILLKKICSEIPGICIRTLSALVSTTPGELLRSVEVSGAAGGFGRNLARGGGAPTQGGGLVPFLKGTYLPFP